MNNNRGFINILLVLLFLIGASAGTYYYFDTLSQDNKELPMFDGISEKEDLAGVENTEISDDTDPTENLKTVSDGSKAPLSEFATYTDVIGLYSLKYPTNWSVSDSRMNSGMSKLSANIKIASNSYIGVGIASDEILENNILGGEFVELGKETYGENTYRVLDNIMRPSGVEVRNRNYLYEVGDGLYIVFSTYDYELSYFKKILSSVSINKLEISRAKEIMTKEVDVTRNKMFDARTKAEISSSVVKIILWSDDNGGNFSEICTETVRNDLLSGLYEFIDESEVTCRSSSEDFIIYTSILQGGYICGSHEGTKTVEKEPAGLTCE